ncbi:MAG: DUF3052 domain-containing protein [Actinomycetaceae bacterium]|nr:DUF3052 domain-containing protein [Actinomycetaceae bacterium]
MSSFGFDKDFIIQEYGYDDDVPEEVRSQIESETGEDLVDEDYEYVADGAIAWWRAEDGDVDDLADLFLDMKANLADDDAVCWLFVPGPSSEGHVSAHEIKEAAVTAGLQSSSSIAAGGWSGVRLLSSHARR